VYCIRGGFNPPILHAERIEPIDGTVSPAEGSSEKDLDETPLM